VTCNSLSKLFETFECQQIKPHAKDFLNASSQVVNKYSGAALISLFDCIAVFAQTMGANNAFEDNNELVNLLMPILSSKWTTLSDDSKLILYLFECFESVIGAIG